MDQKEINWLLENLPEEPDPALLRWARETQEDELGGEYLVYRNERVRLAPEMYEIMENRTRGKSVWATRCACTNCGNEFETQKGSRGSFFLLDGEDGGSYPLLPDGSEDPEAAGVGYRVEYAEGVDVACPYCDTTVKAMKSSSIGTGRLKQIQVAQLLNVGRYTTILYWLVGKEIYDCGTIVDAVPRYAYILGDRGGLTAFSHRRAGVYGKDTADNRWHKLSSAEDRWDARYHDWRSINNTKCGSNAFPTLPEEMTMAGTTGEKTGLWRYWRDTDGFRPVEYLKIWKKRKNVENLINAGIADVVTNAIDRGLRYWGGSLEELEKAADLSKRKPHEMLGVTKAELNIIRQSQTPLGLLQIWRDYRSAGGHEDMGKIASAYEEAGEAAAQIAVDLIRRWGDCDIGKLERYMEKQKLSLRNIGLLRDSRELASKLAGRRTLTEEERWPRRLQQTHDRLNAMRLAQINEKESQRLQGGFDRVRDVYRDLQWNDGHLAVILPKSNQELILEGEVLRHCVGGYGEQHAEGEKIILFIRHYRRPERSYYTLNISFRGDTPREIQLHGYGNERHGDYKQYAHSIPKEVRSFVDRWKNEVLAPWWRQHRKEFIKEKKTA